MRVSKDSSNQPKQQPGEFSTIGDFIRHCRQKIEPFKRFSYTLPDGRAWHIPLEDALLTLEKISNFLAAPDRCDSLALNDGRLFVARHNLAGLMQHLRWSAGLDYDSKPRPRHGLTDSITWPGAAQLWFWSNGGEPLEGFAGDYATWKARHDDAPIDVPHVVEEIVEEMAFP